MKLKSKIYLIIVFLFIGSCANTKTLLNNPDKELTVEVKIDRDTVQLGDSIKLTWITQNATEVYVQGIKKDLEELGYIYITPQKDRNYIFVAKKGKEKKTKILKTYVVQPQIRYFKVTDYNTYGKPIILEWSTKYATNISIEGIKNNLPAKGQLEIIPDSTREYKLIAIAKFDTLEATANNIVTLFKKFNTPNTIYEGKSATIFWKISKADYVTIDGFDEKFKPTDTLIVSPLKTQKYKLTAYFNNEKSFEKEKEIKVIEPYMVFNCPQSLMAGEAANLQWTVKGADRVELVGFIKNANASGYLAIQPLDDIEYTLKIYYNKTKTKNITKSLKVIPSRAFIKNVTTKSSVKKGNRVDVEIVAVDRSKYPDWITLHLIVVDEDGNYIAGMTKKEFDDYVKEITITDDKNKSRKTDFIFNEVTEEITKPYDISIVMDVSGSMSGTISELDEAVQIFIDNKYSKDKISIVKFDDSLATISPLELDKSKIYDNYKPVGLDDFGGGTALYAGCDEGIYSLDSANNNKIIILFTDGNENSSFSHREKHAFTATQVALHARKEKAKIITVSYGRGTNQELLDNLAYATDGESYNINKPEQITEVLNELPRITRNYYTITYKPIVHEGDHNVKIKYNNKNGGFSTTRAKFFTNENFSIDKYDYPKNVYWIDSSGFVGKSPIIMPQVIAFFDFNRSKLLDKYKKDIDNYITYLKEDKNIVATIYGHTDMIGSEDYCVKLSQKRAKTIKEYIVSEGIAPQRVQIVGLGMNFPLWATEKHNWQAAENRRIEIVLYK